VIGLDPNVLLRLVLAALDDFRASTADFSDCLIGRRNQATGATQTVTFDRSLKGLAGFRIL
jgi:predicted nucleic-acid-binding protein